ncbi:MAG: hypothetical protein ACHP7J_00085 [Terriglobales bacterium]
MKNQSLKLALYKMTMNCDANQRYHQILRWRWMVADKAAKILVAMFASLALGAVFLDEHWKPLEITVALIALVSAIVVNVAPFGEYEMAYERLFQGWSKLRKSVDLLHLKTEDNSLDADPHVVEQFHDLQNERNLLNAEETAPYRSLLAKCEADSKQSFTGFRTNAEIEEERFKREKASQPATASASAAAGQE